MTNQQGAPEALRLAEEITELMCSNEAAARTIAAAADELCRLHYENERLAALVEAQKPAPSAAALVEGGRLTQAGHDLLMAATRASATLVHPGRMATDADSPTPQADSAQAEPLQAFDSPRAKALMRAWEEGWAACRDAEYVGEEAQNDAFNSSHTLTLCIAEDQQLPAPQADSQPAKAELFNPLKGGNPETALQMAAVIALRDSQPALDRARIREIFMAHGFTVKEGQTDLKQYVYDAADALLRASHGRAPAGATPGVAEQIRQAYRLVKAHAFDLPDDQPHKSMWDEQAQSLGKALDDLLAHSPTAQPAPAGTDMQDAYVGAREDLAIWKRRALVAERDLRAERETASRLAAEINATNGPTRMGEPVTTAQPAPAATPQADSRPAPVLLSDEELCQIEEPYLLNFRIPLGGQYDFARAVEKAVLAKTYGTQAPQPSTTPQADSQQAPAQAADSVLEDAARYRWLRRWKGQEHEPPFTVQHEIDGTLWGGDLDAAIDAARKQGGA